MRCTMFLSIDEKVIEKYPLAQIGYLTAKVSVKQTHPFVENLKGSLAKSVQDRGINATNFVMHPNLAIWRKIYEEDFGISPKTYRSSVEALLRRVVTGKEMWKISSIVDLYNCISILSLLPMGAYDLKKIANQITVRFAHEGESFHGLGERQAIQAKTHQVVYADDQRLICWLWNHKDSAATCLDENSECVVFFIDGFDETSVLSALDLLEKCLQTMGCVSLERGILNQNFPGARIAQFS